MRNYQKELDGLLARLEEKPSLLIHACCAPCLSYVLEYLCDYFTITVLFYNPNIEPFEEFEKRGEEVKRLCGIFNVQMLCPDWDNLAFVHMAAGMEQYPEGGVRCRLCYEQRLKRTAALAKELKFDYFVSTLSISPLKNAPLLNEIGEGLAKEYGLAYLPSDFKKREGYKKSIELSRRFGLYRQNYCGCVFSRKDEE